MSLIAWASVEMCCPDPIVGGHIWLFSQVGVDGPASQHILLLCCLGSVAGQSEGRPCGQWSRQGYLGNMGVKPIPLRPLNLHLLAMGALVLHGWSQTVFTNSVRLHSGCWLYSRHWLSPSSHFGEFESQSSVIHFAVLPGNSEKRILPNVICLLNERMNGLLN